MKRNLALGIVIGSIVLGMYFLAHEYSLYYIFWWYDWTQHFLGGISLGFLGMYLFQGSIKKTLGLTLGLAILWEIFERIGSWVAPQYLGYGGMGDTGIDILCAILGALAASILILKKSKSS